MSNHKQPMYNPKLMFNQPPNIHNMYNKKWYNLLMSNQFHNTLNKQFNIPNQQFNIPNLLHNTFHNSIMPKNNQFNINNLKFNMFNNNILNLK